VARDQPARRLPFGITGVAFGSRALSSITMRHFATGKIACGVAAVHPHRLRPPTPIGRPWRDAPAFSVSRILNQSRSAPIVGRVPRSLRHVASLPAERRRR
jgi:hypothetical protein